MALGILESPEASSTEAVARGRRICRDVTRAYARTFYFASHGLPRAVREHAYAVYGFCRWADNAVDDAADLAEAASRLEAARRVLAEVYGDGPVAPAFLALRETARARAIPRETFEELLEGMAMDLRESRYADFERLEAYCYRAAGVVGLMMAHLFGFRDPRCLPHAVDLGIAMQLTNILRDVREDLERGRIYLPQDELARFGLGEDDLRRGVVDSRFRGFLRFQIDRARAYYRSAEAGIPDLIGHSSRRTARVMGRLYGEILAEIERRDFDVFRSRARVPLGRKLRLLTRCEWTTWTETASPEIPVKPGAAGPAAGRDPDRFVNLRGPGAHEWWYFDAISDDGRDALVLVWYAALPFDPDYGVAALRNLRRPDRHPKPEPLDHCAIGLSWYREGRTVAYALNSFRAHHFRHEPNPFTVEVAGSRVRREGGTYHLSVRTPTVEGHDEVVADLAFRPAPGTTPFEEDLGADHSSHLWFLAAPDCRVDGDVRRIGRESLALSFRGRGYHDHNAGSEEMSASMRRWRWGRVHRGAETLVLYDAEPRSGPPRSLRIRCEGGRTKDVDRSPEFSGTDWRRTPFGIRYARTWSSVSGDDWHIKDCVDQGPFYLRWRMTVREEGREEATGIGELLETRNMNRFLFNWMIPYRLKRPDLDKKTRRG